MKGSLAFRICIDTIAGLTRISDRSDDGALGCERAERGFPRRNKRDVHERKMHVRIGGCCSSNGKERMVR
jgi:hypothetical protein